MTRGSAAEDLPTAVEKLLELCTVRLDVAGSARGTAFFVAPDYAMTTAHAVQGEDGLRVELFGVAQGLFEGVVADVRPPAPSPGSSQGDRLYPPPDLALIQVRGKLSQTCALLGDARPVTGARVIARGHGRTFDQIAVVTETESFTLSGELGTPDPDRTLLKLGLGQASPGMSGAPVLDLSTGEVIGMLRTSRNIGTNLGAWVVPAALMRRLWPREVGAGHDQFHARDDRWHRARAALLRTSHESARERLPGPTGGISIGTIESSGPVTMISGGNFGGVTITGSGLAGGAGARSAWRERGYDARC